MLIEQYIFLLLISNGFLTFNNNSSKNSFISISLTTFEKAITNSSPPTLANVCLPSTILSTLSQSFKSISSPTSCPYVSLIFLKLSISKKIIPSLLFF